MQENIPDRAVERIEALDENHEIRAAEFLEQPGCDQHELVTRLELALVFELALLGPRRKKKREPQDGQQERRCKPQYRPQPRHWAQAGGCPDDHLAVPMRARKGQEHGQKQRDRKQDIEVEKSVEAEESHDPLGRDGAAGSPRQQAQHQVGEKDGEKHHEEPDGRRGQLSHQTATKNHDASRILTFFALFALFADNAGLCASGPRKATSGSGGSDGI